MSLTTSSGGGSGSGSGEVKTDMATPTAAPVRASSPDAMSLTTSSVLSPSATSSDNGAATMSTSTSSLTSASMVSATIQAHTTTCRAVEASFKHVMKAAANAALDPSFMLLHESARYRLVEVIGKGSYGVVYGAVDLVTGKSVAIKKIKDAFRNPADAARILRELMILRMCKQQDIVELKHVCVPLDRLQYNDVWMIFERLESDLHNVIQANERLSVNHLRVMMYQMLRGLASMHRMGIVHRDLKPKNILAMSSCKLKIADLGLARVLGVQESCVGWTDYVATRWYRPPELLGCFSGVYTPSVDVWSMGCIFAEMMLRRPVLPGKSAVQQLALIVELIGNPTREELDSIPNPRARAFLKGLAPVVPRWDSVFAACDPEAVDLLRGLLTFDPARRLTAEQALAHPFFRTLPLPDIAPAGINLKAFMPDDRALARMSATDLRRLVHNEATLYNPAYTFLKHYFGI